MEESNIGRRGLAASPTVASGPPEAKRHCLFNAETMAQRLRALLVVQMLLACTVLAQDCFVYGRNGVVPFGVPRSLTSQAFGINDRGDIAGWFNDEFGDHGFLIVNGRFKMVDFPTTHVGTVVTGINNSGVAVGSYWDDANNHGFLFNGHSFTKLDYPGVNYTEPFGLNNHGEVVGFYWDGHKTHGFLYSKGHFATLDAPGAVAIQPYSINDRGEIVGHYIGADGSIDGFIYQDGQFSRLVVPSAWYTSAYGINNHGEITGTCYDVYGNHPYVFSHGQFFVLTELHNAEAHAINDTGDIAGTLDGPTSSEE